MILILILALRIKNGHGWFWYKKTPVVEPTNNEMLFKALKNIILELVSTIKLIITMHFIEMMVFLSIIIAILFLGFWLYKGRPSRTENVTDTQSKEDASNKSNHNLSTMFQPNSSTTVNLYGSMQLKDTEPTYLRDHGDNIPPINKIVRVPREFTEQMCIETWLEQIESFLGPFDKRMWVEVTSTYLSEEPYKKIRNMR